jgi:hypothetical protein
MTADEDTSCTKHPGGCEPWDRHNRSVRFRDDTQKEASRVAKAAGSDFSTLVNEATEAALGFIRCNRCALDADPFPVTFGDLSGKTLAEWVAEAVKQVRRQHPRHHPVVIGAQPAGHVVPAPDEALLRARARTRPGAAVFMEPGSQPVITTVPEIPVRHKKGAGR